MSNGLVSGHAPNMARRRGNPNRADLALKFKLTHYPKVRASKAFTARVDEVRAKLNPSEDGLAMILKDARVIGKSMGEMLDPKWWK